MPLGARRVEGGYRDGREFAVDTVKTAGAPARIVATDGDDAACVPGVTVTPASAMAARTSGGRFVDVCVAWPATFEVAKVVGAASATPHSRFERLTTKSPRLCRGMLTRGRLGQRESDSDDGEVPAAREQYGNIEQAKLGQSVPNHPRRTRSQHLHDQRLPLILNHLA